MIRLTTKHVALGTHPFRPGLWLGLMFVVLGSVVVAQDPSVLELAPRESDSSQVQPGQQEVASPAPGISPQDSPSNSIPSQEPLEAQDPSEILPAPDQANDQMDFLMRAPLHEAFAEIPLINPGPSPIIRRRPPEAIEEMPPDYKPDGENVIWIPGYWFWDEEREDFIWISGVWRDAPMGQQWIEGYWHEETGAQGGDVGFRWVSGFWQSTEAADLTYLPQPPEAVEVGPSMPAPSDDYFYVPGTWFYQQSRYVWRPGYYSVYIEDLVWVPPTYIWTPCGYLFRPGYWDKPIDERGLVFAPVFFREPIYLHPQYYYRPTCIIDTGLAILPHLFVRRNRCHYYFGDWYAAQYVQNDFCGWSNLGNHGFYYQQYDPLFNYYSSPVARRNNHSLVYWASQRHRYCLNNASFRPPTLFNLATLNQRISTNNFLASDDLQTMPTSQVFLADNLEHRAKVVSANALERKTQRLVRIDERQQKNELEAINRQLQNQRRNAERELAKGQRSQGQPTQVRITPTPIAVDPARLARKEQEALRRQETQLKIQQKQAEAATRAQARRMENEQRKSQRDLENQLNAQNRQLKRDGRNGDVKLGNQLPGQSGGLPQLGGQTQNQSGFHPQGSGSLTPGVFNPSMERQLRSEQRKQALSQSQLEREQRRQLESTQRQTELAQRQAAEALQRQQSQALRQAQEAARNQQRQMEAQANAMRRQAESQQRQAQEAAQRQESEMRRAAERSMREQQQRERQQERESKRDRKKD